MLPPLRVFFVLHDHPYENLHPFDNAYFKED